jgi:hypothetical protein
MVGSVAAVGVMPLMLRRTGDSGRLQWLVEVPGVLLLRLAYWGEPGRAFSQADAALGGPDR